MSSPLTNPPRDRFTPPGYYVDSSEDGSGGPCLHCSAPRHAHDGIALFCPTLPVEVRACR